MFLTDRGIGSLAVPTLQERQRDYWDASMPGFGIRVSYGGKKAFVVRYRVLGRLRRLTLGPYPALSLSEARKKARLVMGDVARGTDPAEEKQVQRESLRFKDLTDDYLEHAKRRYRRWVEEKRIIEKDLLPQLSWRPLNDIKRADVREIVEGIARKRNAPIMANRTLALLSRLFNFALDREWIEANPAVRIKKPGVEQSRDRVLTDEEVRALWERLVTDSRRDVSAPDQDHGGEFSRRHKSITPATADAFQVQLLTGQRPGEVWSMKWADVNLDSGWWLLPATASKNRHAHRVPLVPAALRILKTRRANAGIHSKFVFENRDAAGSIAHRAKKAASILSRGLGFDFHAHDLRRTVATGMAEAGVSREHIARVLNHIEGGPAATRVYDRYSYDAEKRAALERWAHRLETILEPKAAKVLPMAR